MELLTKTLDMEQERDELTEKLEDLRSEQHDLVDEAIELEDDSDPERYEEIEERVDQLDAIINITEGYLEALDRALEEWGGSEITVRELSGAETRAIGAKAQKRADQRGLDDYSDRFHETLMLENSIEQTPPGCPDPDRIGDLPDRMFSWLKERVNTLNSTGRFKMGNSSLREKMMARRGES